MNEMDPLAIVLSVIDSNNEGTTTLKRLRKNGGDSLTAALDLAERNGLGFVLLERMKAASFDIGPTNEQKLVEAKKRIMEIRRTISMLDRLSRDHGIDYVVIKMPYLIPHIPRDVDVFVSTESRGRAITALNRSGMKLEHSSDVETTLTKQGYAKVDIYSRICYFTVDFLDDDFFQGSKTVHKLFGLRCPLLDDTGNFVLQLLHCLFGHRSMTLLDFLDMQLLMKRRGVLDEGRHIASQHGWGSVFDLSLDRLMTLHDKTRDREEAISFPYVYDNRFILDCVSTIQGLALTKSQRAFLRLSLFVDALVLRSQNSALYPALKSRASIRKTMNVMAHSIRSLRGDSKVN